MSSTYKMIRLLINKKNGFLYKIDTRLAKSKFFFHGIEYGKSLTVYGSVHISQRSRGSISIGSHVTLSSSLNANPVNAGLATKLWCIENEARINIGDHVGISSSVIVAAAHVSIGSHSMIGAGTVITDTDFHAVNPAGRRYSPDAIGVSAVEIGANVWIGGNCFILKGVKIGKDSVVGAGSVVVRDVPEGVLVAGNPARVIKRIC